MNFKFIFPVFTLLLFTCKVDDKSIHTVSNDDIKVKNSDTISPASLNKDSLVISHYVQPIHISQEVIFKIKPKIKRWLKYYDLDINKFEFEKNKAFIDYSDFERVINDTTNYFYKKGLKFSPKEDDVFNPILFTYSPDKTKYIDLNYHGHPDLGEDGNYHFIGGDDSQAIFYFDRKKQQSVYLITFGISQYVEAVFWLNNHDFVLVGQKNHQDNIFFILHVGKDGGYYEYVNRRETMGGYTEYDMKRRGIVLDY